MKIIILLVFLGTIMPVFAQDSLTEQKATTDNKNSPYDLDEISKILVIIVAIVGIGTTIGGVKTYANENKRKRAEQFMDMRKRFKDNERLMIICDLLEDDDVKLKDVTFKEKKYFLGFYEEVALLMYSGLIKKEIAHYMFGYYAIKCIDSTNFWATGVNIQNAYWTTFITFATTMKEVASKFDGSKKFKL